VDNRPAIARFWSRHFLGCELVAGLLLAAGAGAIVELTSLGDQLRPRLHGNRAQIYSVAVGAFVSAFGFLLAVATLVANYLTQPKFERLRRMAVYPQLWRTYWSSFLWFGVGTVASVVALVWDRDGEQASPAAMLAVLAATLVAAFRAARCVWILANIVRVAVPPIPTPSAPARVPDGETAAAP
jgi:hypothetical protein